MREALKPCPFCGGPAELWPHSHDGKRFAWVACMGRCATVVTREHATLDEAIATWNRRVSDDERKPEPWPPLKPYLDYAPTPAPEVTDE